jgi:hypothetical protein
VSTALQSQTTGWLPDSFSSWLRLGFVASITGCVGLVLYCHILTELRYAPFLYIRRAATALQLALALLALISLALFPLNRRLAAAGVIASIIGFALYPIVTAIKEE